MSHISHTLGFRCKYTTFFNKAEFPIFSSPRIVDSDPWFCHSFHAPPSRWFGNPEWFGVEEMAVQISVNI
jgi:hypothetical protein